jgi:hypothetical protein
VDTLDTYLQRRIQRLASRFGYLGRREYPVGFDGDRRGLIDVMWLDRAWRPAVAIEIDSAPRAKSVRKLAAVTAAATLWVYYGRREDNRATALIRAHDPAGRVRLVRLAPFSALAE